MPVVRGEKGELRASPAVWANPAEDPDALEAFESLPLGDADFIACLELRHASYMDLLFDRYARLIRGTAYRVLGDSNEAEEVLQDVFLYIYRKPELFDPSKGTLKAWILQVTICRALDRRAHLARWRFIAASLESLDLPERTDLETEIETKFSRKYLEIALANLPPMQRLTIESFYFDGMNFKEISTRLSEPLGNVRHHFYRGLQRLRRSAVLHRLHSK